MKRSLIGALFLAPWLATVAPGEAAAGDWERPSVVFGERQEPMSNVSGVLGKLREAAPGSTAEEWRMTLVAVGIGLLLLFILFGALRSSG